MYESTATATEKPFRDLDADGRRKYIAALIRDLYPHRQSERAAELIENLYITVPDALADLAVEGMELYDVVRMEIASWIPGDSQKIQAMTERLVATIFATQATTTDVQANIPTLREYQAQIFEINKANGWFDDERTFFDDIALLHSEVSEMLEAYRDHGIEDVTSDRDCASCENAPGNRTCAHLSKPEGFGSEAADVVVRALDTAQRRDIEIPWRTLADLPPSEYYKDATTIGGHVACLHWLIAKIDFLDPDLVLLLSYLTTVCKHLEIDLEFELQRKIAYNATRGYRHGGKRV